MKFVTNTLLLIIILSSDVNAANTPSTTDAPPSCALTRDTGLESHYMMLRLCSLVKQQQAKMAFDRQAPR